MKSITLITVLLIAAGPARAEEANAKIDVAIMDLGAPAWMNPAVVASLTESVAEAVDRQGIFHAVSSADIRRILSYESQRQLLGCDDASCIAELGGALGVTYLITGTLTTLGAQLKLQLQLTNIRDARVEARESRALPEAEAAMAKEVEGATAALVSGLLDKRKGTLEIAVNIEGATVRVDKRIVGVSPLAALEVPAGIHEVTAEREGFVTDKREITVRQSERAVVSFELRASLEYLEQQRSEAERTRMFAYIAGCTGAAALLTSVGFFVLGSRAAADLNADIEAYNQTGNGSASDYDEFAERKRSLGTYDVVAASAALVGGVGLGIGAYLFATGEDPARYDVQGDVAGPAVTLGITPTGVTFFGRF